MKKLLLLSISLFFGLSSIKAQCDAPSAVSPLALCGGGASIPLEAIGTDPSNEYTLNMVDSWGDGWNGNQITIFGNGVPLVVGTITAAQATANSETFTVTEGQILTAEWVQGGFTAEVSFDIVDNNGVIISSGGFGNTIDYTVPEFGPYTLNWYDAPGGTNIGTGSPFDVIALTAGTGSYSFFVTQTGVNCTESAATEVVVDITDVNVDLLIQDVSCIGNADGTFSISNVQCGTLPFNFSVDGGDFGPAPTNLAAGSYVVLVEDGLGLQSAPITVEIGTPPTVVPGPPTADSLLAYCSGTASILLEATASGLPVVHTLNMIDSFGDGWNGNAITILVDGEVVLLDATILNGDFATANFVASEGATISAEWTAGTFTGEVSFNIADADGDIVYSGAFNDAIGYTIPMGSYPLNWYDAATGGNLEGNVSPFEAVGSGVMPAAVTGSYDFFVTQLNGGCESIATQVTVEITDVNVTLSVTDETCTDYTNGGFAILDTLCGTAPFVFQVDSGAFDVAPNLTAGTYSIVVRDADSLFSAPIEITIGTIDSVTSEAPLADSLVYACVGETSILLNATPSPLTSSFTLNMIDSWGDGWNGNSITILANGEVVLADTTIASGDFGTANFMALEGATITSEWEQGAFTTEVSFDIVDNNGVIVYSGVFGSTIDYVVPFATYAFNWYDADTGGTLQGSGNPFESVGTELLPASAIGNYGFYVTQLNGGCESSATLVTLNISNVNVILSPLDVTCNTGADGSFVIDSVSCGVSPFSYSVDGGPAGPAPTDLTAGVYNVMVFDSLGDSSSVYLVTIGNADGPSDLVINELTDTSVNVSWVSNGSETGWTVEYGAVGFTPGAGEEGGSVAVTDTVAFINNLSGNTDYDFYVVADCGTGVNGDWAQISFTTDCGFYTVPFEETFEDDSDTRICWYNIYEVLEADWTYQTGSGGFGAGNATGAAYEGSLNARFISSFTGGVTKLASPRLDLSDQDSVALVFAYAQEEWLGDQNITKVFKRDTDTAAWVEIASYDVNTPDWTVDTLFIVDTTDQLEIAFEGTNNYGYANVVDQIQILPCSVESGIDGGGNVCRSIGTVDLNQYITAGETYGYWSFPANETFVDGSVADVQFLPEGTHDFLYVVKTPCAADTTVATLVIYGPSSAGDDGADSVCLNEPYNLLSSLSGNIDLGGDWIDPQGNNLGSPDITASNIPGSYNYSYITSNGVCDADTSTVLLFVDGGCDYLGLMEADLSFFELYPNPTSGSFNIQANEAEGFFSVEVTDLNGRIIQTFKNYITGNEIKSVDLMNSETGTYFVKIYNNNVFKTFRVVKN